MAAKKGFRNGTEDELQGGTMTDLDAWPALPYEEWAPTRKALHLYAQMLGKLKLALNPPLPEWLHASLALDARGLATGPLAQGGRVVEAGIDLFDNVLWVRAGGDPAVRIALAGGRSVARGVGGLPGGACPPRRDGRSLGQAAGD